MILKYLFLISSIVWLPIISNAQKVIPITINDEVIPKRFAKKVSRMTRKDSTETEKFNRISKWIIKKKSYDIIGFEKFRLEQYSFKQILRKNKLLCREYTVLLEALCKQVNINCYRVEGYVKGAGHYPYEKYYYHSHEWNVLNLDKRYRIVDLTWASGYSKPKISFIGRIKRLLHMPYIPRHWKFVKKANPYYIDIPPKLQVKTHLPIHPMWQLSENPFSIDYFEQEQFIETLKDSNTIYPFEAHILHFSGLSKEEKLIILANEGYIFNPKNNFLMGMNTMEVSYLKWKSFAKQNDIPLSEKAKRSPEVIQYSRQAELYLKKFLSDNDGIKKRCFDSLASKNKEINNFISKRISGSKRKTFQLSTKVKVNNRANKIGELAIEKKEEDVIKKTNSTSFYTLKRGWSNKFPEDSLTLWTSKIEKNNLMLDSLSDLVSIRQTELSNYYEERNTVWNKILYEAQVKSKAVNSACYYDIATNNINHIRKAHLAYDSVNLLQISLEKSLKTIEATYTKYHKRYTDSMMHVATKLISKNKQLLVKKKKYSTKSFTEDLWFSEQNDRLAQWYSISIDYKHKEITDREEYTNFYESWNKAITQEWKEFKFYAKVEKKCYLGWLKNERYRHANYNTLGKKGLLNCSLLIIKSNVFISNHDRAQRLLKAKDKKY